ncbi:MAG: glycosyl hydrolase, partial [Longimicrobiales bacterium]
MLAVFAAVAPLDAQTADGFWPEVTRESRPWTRWWWLGSAVDSAGITAGLEALAAAGFGGVEVTSIYGVDGHERAFIPYLSERWIGMLLHAATETERLGMGIDMPPGSGWRSGGPSVRAEHANASLHASVDTLSGGEIWAPDLSGGSLDAAVAISAAGERIDLTDQIGDPRRPRWQAPAGEWMVYAADTRFSGDSVKRPAPGGEGYSIDVFSRAAVDAYLGDYGNRIGRVPHGALRAYFHDSFEYGGTGSSELFATFPRARGYDLEDHLPALSGVGDPDTVARVKSDYRRTLDEMLLDHFVRALTEWAHARGGLSRNQAHGSPGNLLDLYAAADIPETENFGRLTGHDADPLISKFASSAAHIAGRRLASAESMTWLDDHFTVTLDEAKAAADRLFVSGINHLIYHGTAYSPPDAEWPGWLFYASTQFNSRNAIWRDLPAFNRYVARVQSVLQAGVPDNDVLLYWPIHDAWHDPSGMRIDFRVHDPAWFHDQAIGEVATALWESGYGFDYVSDRLLAEQVTATEEGLAAGAEQGPAAGEEQGLTASGEEQGLAAGDEQSLAAGGTAPPVTRAGRAGRGPLSPARGGEGHGEGVTTMARYRMVVVPRPRFMPPETMERLLDLAQAGATIAFLGELPADVPGLGDLE